MSDFLLQLPAVIIPFEYVKRLAWELPAGHDALSFHSDLPKMLNRSDDVPWEGYLA